jgi:PAS domain S-box-containing protein
MNDPEPQNITGLWPALKRALAPPPIPPGGGLPAWRERILYTMLAPALALGLVALSLAIPMRLEQGDHGVLAIDLAAIFIALMVFFVRSLPYRIRAGSVVLAIFVIGVALLGTLGPSSSGPLCLLTFVVSAAVLLGFRYAVAAATLNILTMAAITWLIHSGSLPWAASYADSMRHWLVLALSFVALNIAAALSIALLTRGLGSALRQEQETTAELARERTRLQEEVEERLRAEEAVRASEEKYRLVAENVSDNIWIIGLADMSYSFISPSVKQLLGYSVHEAMGLELEEVMTPESWDRALGVIAEELKRDGQPGVDPDRSRYMEVEGVRKGGQVIWVEASVRFLRGEDGQPVSMLGISRDISQRKAAEETLRQSERNYRDLFDSISDLIFTQDLEGRFVTVSQAITSIFGYDPGEMVGRKASEFMLPKHHQAYQGDYLDKVQREGSTQGLSIYIDKHGEEHYIEYSSTLVRPTEGEPYISGSGRDVTERIKTQGKVKELQEQLLQSQKMEAVGTLAGGIAHDFNNILAAILGYGELVMDDLDTNHPARDNLLQVLKAGDRAKHLVLQILSFSRQNDEGQIPVEMAPLVNEALELARASLPATIEIEAQVGAQGESVLADPTRMHQVLMNLVTNAFHAMRETGGLLSISLERVELNGQAAAGHAQLKPRAHLCLSVSDDGHGMDSRVLERIFEPFFTTKDKSEGTGMGLAVVHGIVKSHGGDITVESAPGAGSSFRVYLPILDLEEQPGRRPGPAASLPGGRERILLVDDEEAIVDLAKQLLQRLGYRVTTRTSSSQALETFREHPKDFDLVITDYTMPRLTGLDLAREMLAVRPQVPIIICTGYAGQLSAESVTQAGIRRLVQKPFVLHEVARAIREVLDGSAPQGPQEDPRPPGPRPL